MEQEGRIIALDIGTVRIGVALSDPMRMFAQGLSVLSAAGDWIEELRQLIREHGASMLLVGMPRRTDGTDGPEAAKMKKVVGKLRKSFNDVRVETWDERFTTTMAQAALLEGDVSRKDRKGCVDKVAATLLLQNYLDSIRRDEDDISGISAGMNFAESLSPACGGKTGKRKKRNKAYD